MGIEIPITADQGSVFRHLRISLFRNGLRVSMQSGRTRLFGTLATCIIVAAFTFAVGLYLFDQLEKNKIPFKGKIVESLFDLLFFTLGGMLLFSTGIILYASLFTSPEARYLLCSPARADHIFSTKFQGAIAFSSWGFVVLGIPIFLAYGIVSSVPWYFYALLPAYLLGYVLLPGSVSAAICLLLVRYMPRNRRQFFALIGVVATIIGAIWLYRVGIELKNSIASNGRELNELIGQFDLLRSGLAPSHWMSRGVMAAARGEVVGALVPLAQVWSNGLVLFVLATWLAKRIYRSAYNRLAGSGRGKKIYKASRLDRLMESLVFYLDPRTRVLVVKDFRTFRRDPTQWALLIVFGLLMMFGASNFRQYYAADLAVMDKYAISLVNLCGTAILICAGLSRFIFPLISLEGRKFWILGLTPISRDQLLWGKYAFAATGSLIIMEGLILVSDLLIGLPWEGFLLHALIAAVIALGLSAINVGLGAYMPTFQETDPSKIVVGFAGTVNMVVGLGFLVIVIGLMAVPFHTAQLTKKMDEGNIDPWVFAGIPFALLLSAVAIALPMRAGTRSLRGMEF
ncbi:MAG TPA: hypothetical protein VG097_19885 [Gemmata sp.]|jgi:ABC-2 type transport system permease protein|nr:hypothetical protein [Gemmata sp.]